MPANTNPSLFISSSTQELIRSHCDLVGHRRSRRGSYAARRTWPRPSRVAAREQPEPGDHPVMTLTGLRSGSNVCLMHCPRCGSRMSPDWGPVGETLKCERGEMQLSRHMFERLRAYVAAPARERVGRSWDSPPTPGSWFCPACGVAAVADNGYLRCPDCAGVLNDYLYELVELHTHRGT